MSDKAGGIVLLLVVLLLIWMADTGRLQGLLAAIKGDLGGVTATATPGGTGYNPLTPTVTITPTVTHTITTTNNKNTLGTQHGAGGKAKYTG